MAEEATLVMPTGPVPDAGHDMAYRSDQVFAGVLTASGPQDSDCWLCRRGICVRRHIYFAEGGILIVHGSFEA